MSPTFGEIFVFALGLKPRKLIQARSSECLIWLCVDVRTPQRPRSSIFASRAFRFYLAGQIYGFSIALRHYFSSTSLAGHLKL